MIGVNLDVQKMYALLRANGHPVEDGEYLSMIPLVRMIEATLDLNKYPYCVAYDDKDNMVVVISLDGGMNHWRRHEAEAALPECSVPEEWKGENPPRDWMPLLTDEPAVYELYQWDW